MGGSTEVGNASFCQAKFAAVMVRNVLPRSWGEWLKISVPMPLLLCPSEYNYINDA